MRLDIYVNYRGRCEEAFRFYEQHLGGKVSPLVRHADVPNPNISPDWKDKILRAHIVIGGTTLMGADVPTAEPMRSAYLTLTLDTESDAERVYRVLADGGEIFMKMEKTQSVRRILDAPPSAEVSEVPQRTRSGTGAILAPGDSAPV
jgi:PhnB protein